MEILKVNDLTVYFDTRCRPVKAVDGISFALRRGETLGIVGESGSGKSVTALTVMGLAQSIGARIVSGEVWYDGKNLLSSQDLYRQVRGKKISYIPQEAAPALNPVLQVGKQLGEMLSVHLGLSAGDVRRKTAQLLETVELPQPELVARLYPHQLSGGILQRVLLAMALSCGPDIIIADEPASSLDTTIQAQILRLLGTIKAREGLSLILIAHDLGVIYQNCDRVLIMYGGRIMEAGLTSQILENPLHPYTVSLLETYRCLEEGMKQPGLTKSCPPASRENIPDALGCVFAYRCQRAMDICFLKKAPSLTLDDGRTVSCHHLLHLRQDGNPDARM